MKTKGLEKLLNFRRKLESLPQAMRQFEEGAMRAWTGLANKQFDTATNPYGARWKPRKSGGSPVLTGKTRKLRKLKLVRLSGHRWAIVSAHASVLPYHQHGTSRMPRRQIFPEGRFPKAWRAVAQKIHRETFQRHFRG